MAGKNDIHNDPNANTNGFKQNPQNIGKGRKKKIYTVIKEMGYSADDIKTAFGELAFYTLDELKKVYEDESKPIITRIIANQFFTALKKSDWNKIKEILEHVIGKAQSTTVVDLTQTAKINLTDKQIKDISDSIDNNI